ncbi:MAG: murein biosynthesis integral membrane protein MurJ [Bdellovibrionales bacterium]
MSLKRGFFTFGGWTLVSRLAGFVRDLLVAIVLGAGPLADAFVVAQRLPNLFRSLFAEGAFSAAFVPLFTKVKKDGGDDAARTFASETNAVLFMFLFVFTGIMIVGMPWVIYIIAPGFADEPLRYGLAVSLAQITFPYLLLISLTSLQGGILNALGQLAPFAAAPVIYNVIQIVVLLLIRPITEMTGQGAAHIMAWAMTGAGFVQWLTLSYFCRRAGFPLVSALPVLTPSVKTFFRKLGPGVIGAGAAQINLMVSTILASLLPAGAVSYLYYADRLNQLPLGVIGVAISTALLPLLSQAVHDDNKEHVEQSFSRAFDLGLAFGLPAAVALLLMGEPIFQALFVQGAFTAQDAAQSAIALAGYAIGIPAFILVKICATRFFAAHDTATPVRVALVAFAANIAFAIWLMPLWGVFGIALATSLATWVNFLLLRWRLGQQGAFTLDAVSRSRIGKIILSSLVMGAVLIAVQMGLKPFFMHDDWLLRIGSLLALVLAGKAVYLKMILLTRALPAHEILGFLRLKKLSQGPK